MLRMSDGIPVLNWSERLSVDIGRSESKPYKESGGG